MHKICSSGLLALLLAAVLAALPAPMAAQATWEATVTPTAGPPGTRFTFMASGYWDNERLGVWVNTPGGAVIEIEPEELDGGSDRYGRAIWYWTTPADAQLGVWQMVARGADSGHERVIPFTIGAEPAPPVPVTTVAPAAGPPGSSFAFVAYGFADNERLGVWVNTPGGAPLAITVEDLGRPDDEGRADWFWTAPADAQPGSWQMVVRGLDSGVEHVIPFTIRLP